MQTWTPEMAMRNRMRETIAELEHRAERLRSDSLGQLSVEEYNQLVGQATAYQRSADLLRLITP